MTFVQSFQRAESKDKLFQIGKILYGTGNILLNLIFEDLKGLIML